MKKIGKSILIGLLSICLCACSPASKNDVLRYAANKFGEAKYVRTEEISDKEIKYYLCDKEYEFEYYVKSAVNDIIIDGAKFGESESKNSNFAEAYYGYVLSKISEEITAIEDKYGVRILDGLDSNAQLGYMFQLAEVYCQSSDILLAQKVTEEINKLFAAYDTRAYWKDKYITAYDTEDNKLGIYSYKYEKWLTPEDERDVFYYERIQDLNRGAEIVRKEQKVFRDTNISINDVAYVLGNEPTTEDSMVTFYYFTVEGKEYFMADVLISEGGSVVWYNNYE